MTTLPGRDTLEEQVMQIKMSDNFLQKRDCCLLASRKSELASTVSHKHLITFTDLLWACVGVCLLLRVSPFIIAQHIHEGNICQSAEFTCHKPTSKETSAPLITWCSASICHATNSFFLINPNLCLMQVICRKDGRQPLVAFAAIVVFCISLTTSKTSKWQLFDKDRQREPAVKMLPEKFLWFLSPQINHK